MYRMRCKYCGSIDSRPSCLAGAWPVLARPGSQQGSARRVDMSGAERIHPRLNRTRARILESVE